MLPGKMTIDEFLPWAEAQECGRYELLDGEVIAMSPERAVHWEVKFNVAVALRNAIAAAGLKCHVVPDGATVRISQRTAFEPDALVYCGEKVARNSLEVPNPAIVVEVLSPGTQMMDMRDKLRGYFTVPSVHHYLIVDPEKQMVIHHARGEGDALQTRLFSAGQLRLDPPGIMSVPDFLAERWDGQLRLEPPVFRLSGFVFDEVFRAGAQGFAQQRCGIGRPVLLDMPLRDIEARLACVVRCGRCCLRGAGLLPSKIKLDHCVGPLLGLEAACVFFKFGSCVFPLAAACKIPEEVRIGVGLKLDGTKEIRTRFGKIGCVEIHKAPALEDLAVVGIEPGKVRPVL